MAPGPGGKNAFAERILMMGSVSVRFQQQWCRDFDSVTGVTKESDEKIDKEMLYKWQTFIRVKDARMIGKNTWYEEINCMYLYYRGMQIYVWRIYE